MSGIVTGVVEKVWQNKTSTGKTSYALTVDGKRYSAGFDAPACAQGDTVTFSVAMNGQYENVAKGSLKVAATAPVGLPAASSIRGYQDDRQDTISRQAASNTALAFMTLLQSIGALEIKATAKGEAKLEAAEGLLNHYTAMFYEQNTGKPYKSISPAAEAAVEEASAKAAGGWN